MVTMLALALPKMRFSINCLVSGTPGIFMAFWYVTCLSCLLYSKPNVLRRLSSLVFETFLFVLTLYAFFQNVKREYGKHSILFVFIRDGTWAFAIIFGTPSRSMF